MGGTAYLCLGRGGDDLGVVVPSNAYYPLHNALYIHHHGIYRPGEDGKLLR